MEKKVGDLTKESEVASTKGNYYNQVLKIFLNINISNINRENL